MILLSDIDACTLCADRFAATATAHKLRPVVWFSSGVRTLIAGQAPGARVQASGRPFTDPSGDRLRDWMGITGDDFYDRTRCCDLADGVLLSGIQRSGQRPATTANMCKNMAATRNGPYRQAVPDVADRRLCAEMAPWR